MNSLHWKKTEYGGLIGGKLERQFDLQLLGLTEEQCNECLRVLKITGGVETPDGGSQ